MEAGWTETAVKAEPGVHVKTEPSAEHAVHVKHEPLYVKPEETCEGGVPAGESSAAARVKPEPWGGVSAAAARAGLYPGHEARGELVLGPVCLERTTQQVYIEVATEGGATRERDDSRSESETEQQEGLLSAAAPGRCRACSKTFDRPSKLNEHMRSHTGEKPYPCNMCGRRFSRRSHLKRHETLHTGQNLHSCEICTKEFPDVDRLRRHERIHTRTVSGELKAEKPTVLHEQVHMAEKGYSEMCNSKPQPTGEQQRAPGECGEPSHSAEKLSSSQMCILKASLTVEPQRAGAAGKHSCGVCAKQFKAPSKLREHMRIHTKETPYFCKMCGKLFQRLQHLRRHEFLHTGQRPHACGTCEKKFAELQALKLHERTHTGVKPHTCSVCNQSFTGLPTLRIHELIHTGEKPYTCETCSMKFRHSGALARHVRVHTGHKPYTCEICEKRFSDVSHLRKHERVHARAGVEARHH